MGTIGFVNAEFELACQIQRGELPHPDSIFVTLGTMGTAAGLNSNVRYKNLHITILPQLL